MARSAVGKPTFRPRSGHAYLAATAYFGALAPAEQERVNAVMEKTLHISAGAEYALGRLQKYYPKRGATPSSPFTSEEAQVALLNCGLRLDLIVPEEEQEVVLRPHPLLATEPGLGVMVNKHSDNGFPVGRTMTDPAAADKVMRLAVGLRRDLVAAFRTAGRAGVQKWYRRLMITKPEMVALKGKAKADYYKQVKLENKELRFYNVYPRPMLLLMQSATQVLESLALTLEKQAGLYTAQGVSLAYGGAHALFIEMDTNLETRGYHYLHVGDDTLLVVRLPNGVLLVFALDCGSYDLTQHADTTFWTHELIRRQLALIDGAAAELWYCFMRSRLVVVAGTNVRIQKHGGPSGGPLQSKVNDVLMDCFCQRIVRMTKAQGPTTHDEMLSLVQAEAEKVGFVAKLEFFRAYTEGESYPLPSSYSVADFTDAPGGEDATTVVFDGTLKHAFMLDWPPFLGYRLYYFKNSCRVYGDPARFLPRIRYPHAPFSGKREDFQVSEALRLGQIYLNTGFPPPEYARAHLLLAQDVARQLQEVLDHIGNKSVDAYRTNLEDNPFGVELKSDIAGVLEAVRSKPKELWLMRKHYEEEKLAPPPGSVGASANWAEEAYEADNELRTLYGLPSLPVGEASIDRILSFARNLPPQHPATLDNDGRPPPTTSAWGENKPPRPKKRSMRLGAVVMGEREEYVDVPDYDSLYSDSAIWQGSLSSIGEEEGEQAAWDGYLDGTF